jgi:hypothetical protein
MTRSGPADSRRKHDSTGYLVNAFGTGIERFTY